MYILKRHRLTIFYVSKAKWSNQFQYIHMYLLYHILPCQGDACSLDYISISGGGATAGAGPAAVPTYDRSDGKL